MSDTALMTTPEAAALLRVHPKQVYRLLRRGLPGRRVGAEWRFDRAELLAWSGARPARDGRESGEPDPVAPGTVAPPSVVAANGDLAVRILLELASAAGAPLLGVVQADQARGFALLADGSALAAGAHAGGFPSHVGGERAARIHLVDREVGLVHRPSASPPRLADLRHLRLASRPPTAGVRSHLDLALRRARMDARRVHRRALLLDSHLEVVLAVASGRADVGLASRAWGERAGLSFVPLAVEAYGLVVKARHLGDPRLVRLCEVAQGRAFRERATACGGYDPRGAGDIRYDA
jgi:putative molybdopterin biosynthesis protein